MNLPRRLLLPQALAAFAGAAAVSLALGAGWALALGAGLLLSAAVAAAGAVWAVPLSARIESLAATVQSAADRPAGARVAGVDDVEATRHAFEELSARWGLRSAALSAEATTLSAVLDGMAEGLWVTDAQGTIVRHNRALREMLPPGQPIGGQRPLSVIRSAELGEAVLGACARGEPARLEVTLPGARPRTLEVQVLPLGPGLPGSAAVFHDVTELRRLEKVRKDFVANISHELRTPITAIRGYSETLRTGALADPEHAPRMVEIIHRQSERLSALVADLLELSRLEGGEKLAQEPVALSEVAARAAEAVRGRAEERSQRLSLSVDAGLRALGDPRAIEQVLLNLLDNAVKYTPAGGEVEVTGGREGGRCFLSVRDTGIGIEEKHLDRIFERFYRVDRGRSRDTGGTGLGLSIVKHLAGAMGGDVRVESRLGEGSRFTLLLPEARDEVAVPPVRQSR